jgi:superfamily II DNA or RNA helicase
LQTPFQPGAFVTVRGRPWLLRVQVPRADCRELHLEPAPGHRDASAGGPVVLLAPFDRPVPFAPPGRFTLVSRRAWMAAFRAAVLGQREPGSLCAAARANVDLHPYQLEPALAVVRHGARRLLLADAVGLGKTIEAGVVLAELRARSALDRVLVLAPPGLCDQWCAELRGRFGLDPVVADAAWLRSLRPVLPGALNPWAIPGIRVASIDFAKRPEVRRSIERVCWDAVIVDEAHAAAGDSERRAAAHACAVRSRFVLLLTATPHSGEARAFHALCGIGALAPGGFTPRAPGACETQGAGRDRLPAEPIVMFRRNRQQAGITGRRRVHLHRVRPAAAERVVRHQLEDYIRMVWARRTGSEGRDARLAMIVLLKRSLSGMGPLRRSLVARLERLGDTAGPEAVQLRLLLEGDDDADEAPAAALGAPGLDDRHEERAMLSALADQAASAEAHDSKRRALARILARVREPAIVFTEYRDTLDALRAVAGAGAAVLHGGMDRFERTAAVSRFTNGGARVLLATDAAGEGLNLQTRCRFVINLELPWNPMRLEQRIGRVDRIGQPRTVHAVNLLASGTAESEVLLRLAARLDRARLGVGQLDDVLGLSEEGVMAAYLDAGRGAASVAGRPASSRTKAVPRAVRRLDLTDAARDAAARLERQRRLLDASRAKARHRTRAIALQRCAGIAVAAVRCSRLSVTNGRTGVLAIFRVRSAASIGAAPCEELVPVFAEGPCPRMPRRRHVRARALAVMAGLVPRMAASVPPGAAQPGACLEGCDRDARLAARFRTRRAVQRGLFDRRALCEAEEAEAEAAETCAVGGDRRRADTPGDVPPAATPQPVLLLFVTS